MNNAEWARGWLRGAALGSLLVAASTWAQPGAPQTPPVAAAPQPTLQPSPSLSPAPGSPLPAPGSPAPGAPTPGSLTATAPDPAAPVAPAPVTPAAPPTAGLPATTWPTPVARAEAPLQAAERSVLEVDYERSQQFAETAITQGSLSLDETRRAYAVLAISAAQLDRSELADRAFLKLFAIDPTFDASKRLAPGKRAAALNARGFWDVHGKRLRIDVAFDRGAKRLVISSDDPLDWLRTLHVWLRKPGEPFTKQQLPYAPSVELKVDIPPRETLEVYAFASDPFGNTVVESGKPTSPTAFPPSRAELAQLDRDIRGGETGAFARRLEELGTTTAVHGFASLEAAPRPDGEGMTFDLHHATLFFRAALPPQVSIELGIEFEHIGMTEAAFYVPHSFMDLEFYEWLVLRAGFFEAPVGAFNEYLYPDFLRTAGLAPLFSDNIVPALWSEVGLQFRGRVPLSPSSTLTYAVFVSNGLEQTDPAPGDGTIIEGGNLRDMRFNVVDQFHSDKAVGGRVGLQSGGLDVGASGYTGRYTVDGNRRLSLADIDVAYHRSIITVRAEAAMAFQELTASTAVKGGGYAVVSARADRHFEPYLQYDTLKQGDWRHRVLLGNGLYPFPEHQATRTLRLKTEVGVQSVADQDPELVWFVQLTSGF